MALHSIACDFLHCFVACPASRVFEPYSVLGLLCLLPLFVGGRTHRAFAYLGVVIKHGSSSELEHGLGRDEMYSFRALEVYAYFVLMV